MPESFTSTSKRLRKGVVLISCGNPVRRQARKSNKHNSISELDGRKKKGLFVNDELCVPILTQSVGCDDECGFALIMVEDYKLLSVRVLGSCPIICQ